MIPEFYHLNTAISPFDRTHNLQITNLTELPFGPQPALAERRRRGGRDRRRLAGQQHPELHERDAVRRHGERHVAERAGERAARRPGEVGRGNPRRDRQRRAPGSIRWRSSRSPRRASAPHPGAPCAGPATRTGTWACSGRLSFTDDTNLQIRFEAFNALNTAHFNNPGGNVSNLQLNPDGTVRNLNGFATVTSAFGERQLRVGIRLGW